MKKIAAILILSILLVISLKILIVKPPLLDGINFSQAVYDKQQNLLRLTLTADDKYRLYTPLKAISPLII